MGHHQEPADADPKAIAAAQNMWVGFTNLTKYSVIAVVVILLGMAATLL